MSLLLQVSFSALNFLEELKVHSSEGKVWKCNKFPAEVNNIKDISMCLKALISLILFLKLHCRATRFHFDFKSIIKNN